MLALLKKSYNKTRQHIKKHRHYFTKKGPSSQRYVFFFFFSSSFVWMWDLVHKDVWMLKNWCFWTWCWRRLLRVLWAARRSSQSILKEINPDYSLEGLMLKLKIQYFGHLIRRTDSLEKTLMLGKIEGRRRRGRQRMRWLDGITAQWTWVWVNSGSWWWTGRPGVLQSLVHETAKGWTQLSGWADSDCSHNIKRCLLLGRKAMRKLDSLVKSRGITLLTDVYILKAMVFPVVMYGCESWTIKKAVHQRIDAFELWC